MNKHASLVRESTKGAAWPSFSIVIPTYQRRDVVCDAVQALAHVRYPGDIEVVIVVDGSIDGTAAALRAIDVPFPLAVIEQANGGASEARNRGAALARNEVILFLDDDMIAEPDLIEQHARLHREGADAVIGNTPIHPDSPPGFLPESVARWIESTSVKNPLSPFDIFSGQLSVRRSIFQELGGFDIAFTTAGAFGNEDADFGVRLLATCDVRHNPAAISRQVYVVTPRQFMERVGRAVAADVHFIRKHPQLARQLFEAKGFSRPLTRFVYRPLSRIPVLSELLARIAANVAEASLRTPLRSTRAVARFFSGACSVAYWSAMRASGWLPLSNRLLILCYHAIQDQSDDPVLARYSVKPDLFEAQLDSLARRGFSFITPAQLAAFLEMDAPLARRSVLLTFDDGYPELLSLARDVLRPRGIEGIAFIVTEANANQWDQAYGARPVDLMNRDQLRELIDLGISIGSHSRTHGEMQLMNQRQQESEASGSIIDLERKGLPRPRFFAYPYGARNSSATAAVRSAGFLAAFGLSHRWTTKRSDRFDLPRIIVLSSDRGFRFLIKTAAPGLVGWYNHGRRLVDAALGRVRA